MHRGYAVLNRSWKKGDVVEMVLPLDAKKIAAHEAVKDGAGKLAVQRGPLVYCAEWPDNGGRAANILLPAQTAFSTEYKPDVLGGITQLKAQAPVVTIDEKGESINTQKRTVTLIPYYAWANRGEGEMTVWFPERVKDIEIVTTEAAKNTHGK